MKFLAALASLLATTASLAQNVTFNGSLGDRIALLVIDGQPRSVTVGQTFQGVRLLSVSDGDAKVEVGGRQMVLRIGAAPVRLAGAVQDGNANEVVLEAGLGGHFASLGTINGGTVQFLVDTGATFVSLSQADAQRIGIQFKNAPRLMTQTANGVVPVHRVLLNSVKVGNVEIFNVEAVIVPATMSHVLLGNSFLTRFQMKRENDRLTLVNRM